MPLISFACDRCGKKKNKMVRPKDIKSVDIPFKCDTIDCEGSFKRILGAPKSVSKIIIDDGQAKAIEVMPDIQEILDQNGDKGPDRGSI